MHCKHNFKKMWKMTRSPHFFPLFYFFFDEFPNQGAVTLDPDQATWMASLLCIGALFGSLSAVFLMDAVGRKVS